jgi:hypothetical protein
MLRRSTIIAAVVLGLAPAQAMAASGDVVATRAYIQANYALARTAVALIGPAQAKIESFNGQLARECPRAGAGSPENEASQPISHEVAVALWSVAYAIGAAPVRTFVSKTSRLRWSNHTITRLSQRYARSLHEMVTLPLPHLCEDVRAWKASGFQVIPAGVASLVQRVEAIELNPIPPRLLAPYERGADASTLKRTIGLGTKLAEAEFIKGQTDWIQVLETLGLNE